MSVELIGRLLTAHNFTLPMAAVQDDTALTSLMDLGLVEVLEVSTSVLCHSCDAPHAVKIDIDPITDRLGWRCPEAGSVEAAPEHLQTVRLLSEGLVEQIATVLQTKSRHKLQGVEGLLWNIGWFEYRSNDVNVFLASRIRDSDDTAAIAAALASVPSLRNALVLAPDIAGTVGLAIAGCAFAEIGAAFDVDASGIHCDQARIAGLAGVELKRGGGRSSHEFADRAMAIIKERYDQGKQAASKRAEAREVAAIIGRGAPSRTTLDPIISEVWSGRKLTGNSGGFF